MAVYKRPGSPYFTAEFIVGGHRTCRSTKATSEREAKAVEKRWKEEARAEARKAPAAASLLLSRAFGQYLVQKAPQLAESWQSEVARYCTEISRIMPETLTIEEMTDAEVNDYVQARLLEGAGPYAINRALAVWRRVHNVARKTWKLQVQVVDWAEHMNAEDKRVASFTLEQVRHILKNISPAIGLAVEWSVYTGCRREETFGLTWDNVKLDESKAEVIAKGGRQHTVWLGPQALDVLGRCDPNRRYVFDGTNRRRIWEAGLKRAGLEGHRWHDLRHTHATWLRQAGIALEVVQRSLGHADLATTMRYAHVADRELQTALHALPSISTSRGQIVSIFDAKSKAYGSGADD